MDSIQILQACCYICIALAVIFLGITIALFFVYKIKDLIFEISGKAKAQTTSQMSQSYDQTGSLRETKSDTPTAKSGKNQKKKGAAKQAPAQKSPVAAPQQQAASAAASDETNRFGDTELISNGPAIRKVSSQAPSVAFTITKDVLVVNTTERVI